ncbi:MAG: MBL fold metallo-hydrolase [Thermodesulfobacteriota bacterium]|nr:MBL fold metallo-hydrolase [Thermodesulfobacteriota bacterium]
MSVKIEWLGNAAFRMIYKGMVLFVDPWLDENPGCPLKTSQVKHADMIFVTHGHPGHWGRGDSVKLANATGALYVAPRELCDYLVSKRMIPDHQVYRVEPGKKYDLKGLPFEVLSAPHPPVPSFPAWLAEIPGEPNCGYLWDFDRRLLLNFGDAEYHPIFEEVGEKYQIELTMLPLWGEGMGISMEQGVKTCADIISAIKPQKVFPTNRYSEDNPAMKFLVNTLKERGIQVEVFPQKVGLTFQL